jgi:hypothetical protein
VALNYRTSTPNLFLTRPLLNTEPIYSTFLPLPHDLWPLVRAPVGRSTPCLVRWLWPWPWGVGVGLGLRATAAPGPTNNAFLRFKVFGWKGHDGGSSRNHHSSIRRRAMYNPSYFGPRPWPSFVIKCGNVTFRHDETTWLTPRYSVNWGSIREVLSWRLLEVPDYRCVRAGDLRVV